MECDDWDNATQIIPGEEETKIIHSFNEDNYFPPKKSKKLVILLSGKMQSGKNTFSNFLFESISKKHPELKLIQTSFALHLKNLCKEAFKPLTELLNYYVETELGMSYYEDLLTKDENWYEKKNIITRMILQCVGTEVVRKIDSDYWAKCVLNFIKENDYDIVFLTDTRFENEIKIIKNEFNTYTLRIRKEELELFPNDITSHPSETALDKFQFDMIINNYDSLDKLKYIAEQMSDVILNKFENS